MPIACCVCGKTIPSGVWECPHCGALSMDSSPGDSWSTDLPQKEIQPPGGPADPSALRDTQAPALLDETQLEVQAPWQLHFQAGLESIAGEDFDTALTRLSQSLLDAPDDQLSVVYATRGYVYLSQDQNELAIDDCTASLRFDSTNFEAFAWRGSAHANCQQWREAIQDYTRAITLSPENAEPYRRVATSYTETALEEIRAHVRQGEASAELFLDRAVIYAFLGDTEKAIRDATQAIDLDGDLADAYISRAECFALQHRYEQVDEDCTQAIHLGATHAQSFFLRGTARKQLQRLREAVADASQVLKFDEQNLDALCLRAAAHAELGNHILAISDWSAVIREQDDHAVARRSRGASLAVLGEFERAVDDYARALQVSQPTPELLVCRGEWQLKLKRPDAALADFDAAIELDPVYQPAYRGRCCVFAAQSKFEEALAEISKAIRLNGRYAEARAARAVVYHEMGDYKQAIRDYSGAIRLGMSDEEAADTYYRRGSAYLQLKHAENAIRDFSSSLRMYDQRAGAFLWRGITYSSLGMWRQAIDDLNRAIQRNTANEAEYREVGAGICRRAIKHFTKVIEREPQHVFALRDRAIARQFLGQFDEALKDVEQAVHCDPEDLDCRRLRAELTAQSGSPHQAIEHFSSVLQADSDCSQTWYERGRCYQNVGDLANALSDFRRAVKIQPRFADALVGCGEVYAAMGRAKSAAQAFTIAVEADHQHRQAYMHRGMIYVAEGEFQLALRDFDAAILCAGSEATPYFLRAEALVKLGRTSEAQTDFEKALAINPGHAAARCGLSILLARQDHYELAIIQLTKAIAMMANEADRARLLLCRGRIYYSAGRVRAALDDYETVIRLHPPGYPIAPAHYGRGLVLLVTGQYDTAALEFQQAARLDPHLSGPGVALAWLRDPTQSRPKQLLAPSRRIPATRPPVIAQPGHRPSPTSRWDVTDAIWNQWIVADDEQKEYGPVDKATLDQWCAEGRIDAETQLLRIDWDQSRGAVEIYPELLAAWEQDDDERLLRVSEQPRQNSIPQDPRWRLDRLPGIES